MAQAIGFYKDHDGTIRPITSRKAYRKGRMPRPTKSYISINPRKPISYQDAKTINEIRSPHAQIIDDNLIARKKYPKGQDDYSKWAAQPNRSDVEGIDVIERTEGLPSTPIEEKQKPVEKAPPKVEELKPETTSEHPITFTGNRELVQRFQPLIDDKFGDLKDHPLGTRKVSLAPTHEEGVGGYFESKLTYKRDANGNYVRPYEVQKVTPVGIHIRLLEKEPLLLLDNSKEDLEKTDNESAVHEVIHLRRTTQKDAKLPRLLFDTNQEERETVHETGARQGAKAIQPKTTESYYIYVGGDYPEKRVADLKALGLYSENGITNTNEIEDRIKEKQGETKLSHTRIAAKKNIPQGASPDLNIDRRIKPEEIDQVFITSEGDRFQFYAPFGHVSKKKLARIADAADGKVGEEKVYEVTEKGKQIRVR